MKRLSLVLTILVTLLNVHLYAATFTASKVEITPGQTAQLVIGMNNTETNLSGFQFKLYLPEGLSVTTNTNGQFVYTQSGRIANHTVNFRKLDDGGYLVVVYSMDADVITGSSGELMSISVTANETASTSGNGTLSNIRVTDVSSSTSSCDDVTIDVTITPNVINFIDANVKALCVANWDTNGDGELDEAEAAAVTDLGSVFKDNRTITSFNELQYFTGLTSIGYSAFYYCTSLTSVTIPNSVTSIGEWAFSDCSGLTSVVIPESVTSIGNRAFYYCSGLTSVVIPESVTSIGAVAFGGCDGLTSIKVDEGNTVYDSRDNCNAIIETNSNTLIAGCQNTVIPNSVTSIGEDAFFRCQHLTSITIPGSVTSIGVGAFEGCSGLTSVTIGNSVASIGNRAFMDCNKLTSITIPESVTSIGTYAFAYCSSLTSITIPNNVTSIGTNAFQSCSGLTSVTIGNSVTSIGYSAFYDCSGLTSITIPESVTSIGDFAFGGCSSLTSITIPENVTSIGSKAFGDCSGLTEVYCYAEQVPSTDSDAFYETNIENATLYVPKGSVESYKATSPWSGFGKIVAITEEAKVGSLWYAFDTGTKQATVIASKDDEYSGDIVIPASVQYQDETYAVTRIDYRAFNGCSGLTAITIPNSVSQTLSTRSFYNCDNLTKVTLDSEAIINQSLPPGLHSFIKVFGDQVREYIIGNSVTSITCANFQLLHLTSLTIGSSVNIIYYQGMNPFRNCYIEHITVNAENSTYDSRDNCNAIIETATNTLIIGCENTIIPRSVTSIGNEAFYECSNNFTSITIPENVTSIGSKAFGDCSGLTEVYCYAEQVPNTSSDAFYETNIENATLYVPKGSVESYKATSPWSGFGTIVAIASTLPDVAKIGSLWYAIDTETRQAIVIASKDDEYSGDIVIPASVQYQDETYAVTEIDGSAFNGCSGLTAVTIPNSVTGLPRFGFSGCNNLATVTLDCWAIISKVYPGQSSREFARLFGDQVKECIIGNSVTYIGNLFEDCSSIESITIGSNVEEIRSGAFRGCDLVSITVNAENRTYDSRDNCNAIIDTNNNILVLGCRNTVIPSSVKSIDARAFYCCSLTSITIPSSVTLISTEAFYGCTSLTNITSYIKEPFAIDNSVFEGIPYETATLFVPAGTIDAYKATDGWKNFQNIETILQQLTIAVVGDGTVTFSGEALTNTTATFKVGGEVHLQLTPDEGCHIERVMVNQQDCTAQVTGGVLTLNITDEDFFVLAEFQHDAVPEPTYVNYTIYIDGLGDVRVKDDILSNSEQTIRVPQGSNLVLEFLPDEGQMMDKVTWNGETVTEQALGNTFVVHNVQEDGTVSVIFMERIETFEYAGIRYGVTNNTQRTLKVLPADYSGHLSIPESIEHSQRTWQVQEIGSLAFANCEWLVSVKIPASITEAGQNLFKRDTRLAAIQWDAELPLRTEVTGEQTNANMLYYVKDRSYAPQGGNVIVNGMADNISLSDGHDFYCPEAFKAKKVAYSHNYRMLTRRGYCQGWETLALPFNVKTIRLSRSSDNNPEIYPYESLTDDEVENKLPFWLYSYGDDDKFAPAASIEANTPYIISMPNDVTYLPKYRLAGNVTFSAQDDSGVDVYCTSDENLKVPGSNRHFQPSYQRQAMGNDCYLVNVNDNSQYDEGSKFIQALRPARPFEAYMISQTTSVKPWYDIFEQMPTGIRDIPAMDNEEEMANGKCYDLSGRQIVNSKLSNCKLHRGIYIINGRKQVIK